jgi:hypothetical protein
MNEIHIWQIGPDGTEYYAAYSEQEMKTWYRQNADPKTCEDDLRDDFEEITDLNREFDFTDDGVTRKTTWRELLEGLTEANLPTQISTGYL